MTFADKTSAQQLPQTSISRTAQSGSSFADFGKQQQARLLAAIDNTLATEAEDAISENFGFIKRAGVHLQSGLGGRKSGGAINVIGAFAESDSHAFGWQLRAYAAEGGDKGGNVGLFYRHIGGGILYGANAFLDYEDGDYGDFLRYGIGGELSNSVFALAANYYAPQTDDRKINATVAAFSREGYDAKLRLNAPGYREVKAAFDYYHFDGKGETAKDAGWRYGLEFVPIPSFHFALYYDDSAETIGGDIGYSHTIGEVQKRESNAAFSPDLFAAVSREYSQRIATVAIASDDNLHITPPVTTIMTMETEMIAASRVASVHFTARYDFAFDIFGLRAQAWILVTSTYKHLITLPDIATSPLVVSITGSLNRRAGNDFYVIARQNNGHMYRTNSSFDYGAPRNGHAPFMQHTLTITEGSEEFVSVTTTLTTRTTTTMAAVTTRIPVINTSIVIMTMRTTTAITAAAITTTARMTAAAVTTRTTTFPLTTMATRMASVHFTTRYDFTRVAFGQTHALYVVITSSQKLLVTLPSPMITHPLAIRITGNIDQPGEDGRVIMIGGGVGSLNRYVVGHPFDYSPLLHPIGNRHTLNIVQGSEEIISVTTTLTTRTTTTMAEVITETPMTMAAVSTTTRITTFSTMTVTLTANSAMGDMGDSRFRGNDEGGGNDERGGKTPLTPPSKMPKIASANIPIIHHQKRADIPTLTYPPAPFRHSLTRHSRESGNLLNYRRKAAHS